MLFDISVKAPQQSEGQRLRRRCRRVPEQGQQARLFVTGQGRVKHQLAGLRLMVADQRPGIQAKDRITQPQIVMRLLGQRFDTTTEIVRQIAEQTAGKRQVGTSRQLGSCLLYTSPSPRD